MGHGVLDQRLKNQGGTRQSAADASIRRSTFSRLPNRTCSMSRNRSAKRQLVGEPDAFGALTLSVLRRKSASRMHMRLAPAGSLAVSALIEFKLL